MTLKELLELNHDCNSVFIRESDGNLSKPVFSKTLTSEPIPDEVLLREVKHFQAGVISKPNGWWGCLNVTLKMQGVTIYE